jgi:hypothetical protein
LGRASTLERLAPAIVIAATAWLALFPIKSVDAYYHLAVGKWILETGEIPSRGVGSATFGSEPWHDNEWGFQVFAAALGKTERDRDGVLVLTRRGRISLILMRAAFCALTLGSLSAALRRMGVSGLARALALWLLAFLTFGNLFWDVRPQIVSYAIFAAILWLLEEDRAGRRFAVPAILAATALWANVHAAFPVGVVLVGAEAIGSLWDGRRDRDARRRGLRLLGAAALMPLAAALNPHGFEQVTHPLRYVFQPEIHAGNAEWFPPDFRRLPLLLGTLAWAIVSWGRARPLRAAEILRIAVFLALSTTALRHLPFAAMVFVSAGARAAASAWRFDRVPRWGGAGALAIAIVALSGSKFVGPFPRFEESMVRPMPERAVRFLVREAVEGNGFNAYRFGGFLMFRMYPEERVFMDGRNDLYGMFRHRVYNPILFAEPGWEKRLDEAVARFDIGWILVDAADPLAVGLAGRAGWIRGEPPSTDGSPDAPITLFLRDSEANRERLSRWPGR